MGMKDYFSKETERLKKEPKRNLGNDILNKLNKILS